MTVATGVPRWAGSLLLLAVLVGGCAMAPSAPPVPLCPTAADLRASYLPTDTEQVVSVGPWMCDNGWAVALLTVEDAVAEANPVPYATTTVFRRTDSGWRGVARDAACRSGELPISLEGRACNSN